MLDGVVKALQQLGFTFKNPAIDDILSENESLIAVETRFMTSMARCNIKRLKQEGRPYLDLFRKLITEYYKMNRLSDIDIYTNAYFKAILDQIDIKINKELKDSLKPYRKAIFEYYLKEKDALIQHFIESFLDEISKNIGNLKQIDIFYIYYVFKKCHAGCALKCDQVYAENRHIDDVCKSLATFISIYKKQQLKK